MPSFEEILMACVLPNQIAAAKAREKDKKWLYNDPSLTKTSEGMRQLCVTHHVLVSRLIAEQYGWNKKQIEPALRLLNDQHGGALFANVKTESWCIKQMDQHVRNAELNSIDFTRLSPTLANMCQVHRHKRLGTPSPSTLALLTRAPSPTTPSKASASSEPKHRLVCKTSPTPASTPKPSTMAESPDGALPNIFRSFYKKRLSYNVLPGAKRLHTQVSQPVPCESSKEEDIETQAYESEEQEEEEQEEDEEEEEPDMQVGKQAVEHGTKIYFDFSLNSLVKLYPSGAIAVAVMSDGPNGFKIGKWPDGSQAESEEPNGAGDGGALHQKAPKKTKIEEMKKPAAQQPLVPEPIAEQPVVRPAAVPVIATVVKKPTADKPVKAAVVDTTLPEKPPKTELKDGSILFTTFGSGQAYIQAQAEAAGSKSLLVSISRMEAERHGKHAWHIMLAIHQKMAQTGKLMTKQEALDYKQQLLNSEQV